MRVVVWSERNEPAGGGWTDCTYASYLMIEIFGGKWQFPKLAYTVAEREAFERSDTRPDETGANLDNTDDAARNRYGAKFVLPKLTMSLADALNKVGYGLVVQGTNSKLTPFLRRWDPGFDGGHCVAVVPVGGGKSRWLDPLAPSKYEGDVVDNAVILKWAFGKDYARIVKADVFLPAPVVVPPPVVPPVIKPPVVVPPVVPTKHYFHAAIGHYTTYQIVNGRIKAVSVLQTKGFKAEYQLLKATQADGTGTTTILKVSSGLPAPLGYRNKLLYRYAPGISILS